LPCENEIALANINIRKQADDECRKALKARKAMSDLNNVVDEGVVLSDANLFTKRELQRKINK